MLRNVANLETNNFCLTGLLSLIAPPYPFTLTLFILLEIFIPCTVSAIKRFLPMTEYYPSGLGKSDVHVFAKDIFFVLAILFTLPIKSGKTAFLSTFQCFVLFQFGSEIKQVF